MAPATLPELLDRALARAAVTDEVVDTALENHRTAITHAGLDPESVRTLLRAGASADEAVATLKHFTRLKPPHDRAVQAAALLFARKLPLAVETFASNEELFDAATLLERGVPARTVAMVGEEEWLRDIVAAIDAGLPVRAVKRHGESDGVGFASVARLLAAGLPVAQLDRMNAPDTPWLAYHCLVRDGLSWDDVEWLETHCPRAGRSPRAPMDVLVDRDGVQPLAGVPDGTRMLAAALACTWGWDPAAALLVATAARGQAWEGTVLGLTLATDAEEGLSATTVLSARALEDDPLLPRQSHTERAWRMPAAVAGLTARPGARLQDMPAQVRTAVEEGRVEWDDLRHLVEAGADPVAAVPYAQWLGDALDSWRTVAVVPPSPGTGTALDYLAAAVNRGTPVVEARLAATVRWDWPASPTEILGLQAGAAALACGARLDQLEGWSRRGIHPLRAALIHAYGVPAEQAASYAAMKGHGLAALTALMAGAGPDDLPACAAVLETLEHRTVLDLDQPPSVELLTAIAQTGAPLAELLVDDPTALRTLADPSLPLPVARLGLELCTRLSEDFDIESLLTLAAAWAGRPWVPELLATLAPASGASALQVLQALGPLLDAEDAARRLSVEQPGPPGAPAQPVPGRPGPRGRAVRVAAGTAARSRGPAPGASPAAGVSGP